MVVLRKFSLLLQYPPPPPFPWKNTPVQQYKAYARVKHSFIAIIVNKHFCKSRSFLRPGFLVERFSCKPLPLYNIYNLEVTKIIQIIPYTFICRAWSKIFLITCHWLYTTTVAVIREGGFKFLVKEKRI